MDLFIAVKHASSFSSYMHPCIEEPCEEMLPAPPKSYLIEKDILFN